MLLSHWLVAGLLSSFIAHQQAPTIRYDALEFRKDKPEVVYLSGNITHAEALNLDYVLLMHPKVTTVVLQSLGGTVEDALIVASTIQRHVLDTVVPPGASCMSACVLLFIAGENRRAMGVLGVHQMWSPDGGDTSQMQTLLAATYRLYAQQGVSPELFARALATKPQGIDTVKPSELKPLGLNRGHVRALKQLGYE